MNIEQESRSIGVGKHIVELVNVSEGKRSKTGLRCIVFKWFVITGEHEGCFISDRFYMGTSLYYISTMIKSLGRLGDFNENGTVEYYYNQLAGKRTIIDVKEETYQGTPSMNVKKYGFMDKKQRDNLGDIDRIASVEYEAPEQSEADDSSGGGSSSGVITDDDIPF